MRVDVTQRANAGHGGRLQPGGSKKSKRPDAWRVRNGTVLSSIRLAVMRLSRGWKLLVVVGVGILVAVVLICTVPLYDSLVANIQLQRAINTGDPTVTNLQPTVHSGQISVQARDQANRVVSGLGDRYFKNFTSSKSIYYPVSDDMLMLQAGQQHFDPASLGVPNLIFEAFDYSTAGPHMHFVSGGVPQSTAPGQIPQTVVTQQMAQNLDLKVGDQIVGTEFGNHSRTIAFTVAGIWVPNPSDPFWNGATFGISIRGTVEYRLLITDDTFFNQLGAFPGVGMQQTWIFYTDSGAINTGNMGNVATAIGNFRSRLNGEALSLPGVSSVGLQTGLDSTISNIESQESLLELPLYIVVAQIAGLALLFVAAMAGLLIEGQSQEIATLKSRGASGTQLLFTFTSQGVLLGLLAAIAGPFLASLLGLALIRWFIPPAIIKGAGVGSSYFGQLASPGTVILPAALGAILGAAVVTFSAWQSSRLDVLAFRREQGRSTRIAFWKRYYLDLLLAVLCLVGYLELDQFGGAGIREQLGGSTSPLLLLAPLLLLLAGALLVLRFFPYGAALCSRLAARGRGLAPLLAFSQVERNPARYSRLTLLLVLAVGLGLFALAFASSLVTNDYERAAYAVGSDIRFSATTVNSDGIGVRDTATLVNRLLKLPGVEGVSQAYRDQVFTTPDEGSNQLDALGIDAGTFQQDAGVISWRSDYAGTPLPTLLAEMRVHSRSGKAAGSVTAPIWTIVSAQFAGLYQVNVGDHFTLEVGGSGPDNVQFVVGAIVNEFPTLYPESDPSGFIVMDLNDYLTALRNNAPVGTNPNTISANEFWMRTSANGRQHANLLRALASPTLIPQENASVATYSLADQASQNASNPVSAGMRGLLLVGAVTAAVLAILGSIVQAMLATQQRARQFAVMRTVGMSGRQITVVLLGEQVVVYLFGLVGGTLLGLLLVTATLPFLQFSDTTVDPATVGVPPYILTFNGQSILYFYIALLLAFLAALLIASRYANSVGLGEALRLGED